MHILISGAGIAGPTLAWFLSKSGHQVTILEKAPSLLAHGQNIDIVGNGIKIMRKMGLLEEVLRHGTREEGTQFISPSGHAIAPFPVNSSVTATSQYEILRSDLATLLYDSTRSLPNVTYLFSTTLTSILSSTATSITVTLSSSPSPQTFSLLVACDGQWSPTRTLTFPPSAVSTVDRDMYVVYFTIPRLASDNSWWNIYLSLGKRTISVRPDPHGTLRAMLTCMPLSPAHRAAWIAAARLPRKAQEEHIRREFADAGWQISRILDAMSHAEDLYVQPMWQIKMDRWSEGRVVCVGDAAHASTPLTGQGTTLAIMGAWILAGELSEVEIGEEGKAVEEAMREYERKYHPHVDKIQDVPWFIPRCVHYETEWGRWAAQTAMRGLAVVVRTPWVGRWFSVEPEENNDGFELPEYPRLEKWIAS